MPPTVQHTTVHHFWAGISLSSTGAKDSSSRGTGWHFMHLANQVVQEGDISAAFRESACRERYYCASARSPCATRKRAFTVCFTLP